jgi:hypothetical protein
MEEMNKKEYYNNGKNIQDNQVGVERTHQKQSKFFMDMGRR